MNTHCMLMRTAILLLLFTTLIQGHARAQSWSLLPASPSAGFRHDDLFFINADTGWVVNVDGHIYKTTDGGASFASQLYQIATSFRCVGFADANRGWAGNLGPGSWSPTSDTNPLYQTTDGGTTWSPVTSITGPMPTGICGIDVVDDSVVYAVGRVGGPCHILKTTNGGTSWTSTDFADSAWYLIDVHFFSPDTGLVVGSGLPGATYATERYGVFYTTDGAATWTRVAASPTYNGHGWKIDFPSRQIGYVSIETSYADSVPVLKTTNGGLTWQEHLWSELHWFAQGIGFVNDTTGVCGSAIDEVKKTTDGGLTWAVTPFVQNFNRFRKVNDSVAYASGNRIWKFSNSPPVAASDPLPAGLTLEQNYPNPFSSSTSFTYHIPQTGHVLLRVYDIAGRPVKTLVDEMQETGEHSAAISLRYLYDTHFFCTLQFGDYTLTRKMLMVSP